MTRIILRLLNGPALILIMAIAIALQTSLFVSWPLSYFQPDLVLLAVIWFAMRRGFIEGGILTLIIANLAESHSGAINGIFLITYMLVFLGVRLANKLLVIPGLSSYAMVTLFAAIGWRLSGLGVLHLLGKSVNQWRHTLIFLFPGAVLEALIAFWAYPLLEKLDLLTFKQVRPEQILEEELGLGSAGRI
ncbi:MAG: hypothetical protein ACXWPM_05460 [Bdellovibrionota bacterium]